MKCTSRNIAESVQHEWTLHIRCYTHEKENIIAENFGNEAKSFRIKPGLKLVQVACIHHRTFLLNVSSHENSPIPSKAQTLGSALNHAGYSFTDSQM